LNKKYTGESSNNSSLDSSRSIYDYFPEIRRKPQDSLSPDQQLDQLRNLSMDRLGSCESKIDQDLFAKHKRLQKQVKISRDDQVREFEELLELDSRNDLEETQNLFYNSFLKADKEAQRED
jgi:ribonuclease I